MGVGRAELLVEGCFEDGYSCRCGWVALDHITGSVGLRAGALQLPPLPDRPSQPPSPECSCLLCCSKGGNNNTYCHDSPLNYLDWQAAMADDDGLLRFTRHMIGLRCVHCRAGGQAAGRAAPGTTEWRACPAAAQPAASSLHHGTPTLAHIFALLPPGSTLPACPPTCLPLSPCRHSHKELRRTTWIHDGEVQWHGPEVGAPDWTESSRFLAYSLRKPDGGGLYIAFNSGHTAQVGGWVGGWVGGQGGQGSGGAAGWVELLRLGVRGFYSTTPTPEADSLGGTLLPAVPLLCLQVVQLPKWPGRVWQLVSDTSKVREQCVRERAGRQRAQGGR